MLAVIPVVVGALGMVFKDKKAGRIGNQRKNRGHTDPSIVRRM